MDVKGRLVLTMVVDVDFLHLTAVDAADKLIKDAVAEILLQVLADAAHAHQDQSVQSVALVILNIYPINGVEIAGILTESAMRLVIGRRTNALAKMNATQEI